MTDIAILAVLLTAAAISVGLERYLSLHARRLREDRKRIDTAIDALKAHQEAVDFVLSRDSAGPSLRYFLLEISEGVTDHEFARQLLDYFRYPDSRDPSDWDDEDATFDEELRGLERRDVEAFAQVQTAFRMAIIASILQWPDTARGLAEWSMKMAASKPEVSVFRHNIRRRPHVEGGAPMPA